MELMMSKIKSLDDLKKIREEALEKRKAKMVSGEKQIVVGMGTVGIAAGARDTLKTILEMIEQENLTDVIVRQTGNIGFDSFEPIVQVVIGDTPAVNYGKVTPAMVKRIIREHVIGNEVVKEFVINV